MQNNCIGEKLVLLGAAIAVQIAQCVPADNLGTLGALLTVIGDQLALIAGTRE